MQTLYNPSKRYAVFTLIELLIVMAVIVILMGIGMLGSRYATLQAHKTRHRAILREWAKALNAYYLDHGEFPYGNDARIPAIMDTYLAPYFDDEFYEPFGQKQSVYYRYYGYQSDHTHTPVKITSVRIEIVEYEFPFGSHILSETLGDSTHDSQENILTYYQWRGDFTPPDWGYGTIFLY